MGAWRRLEGLSEADGAQMVFGVGRWEAGVGVGVGRASAGNGAGWRMVGEESG